MPKVRFADVSVKDPNIVETVIDVLGSGSFINGNWNKRFAEAWAERCLASFCVPVASGSAAIIAALKAVRSKLSRNLVVIPDLSFAATAFAVLEADCTPMVCGVDEHGLMDQDHCTELLGKYNDIIAVMPVHLYGQVLPINSSILDKVPVIEDACQAHGTSIQGAVACFSFYPSKNLGAVGDAGAVVTNLSGLANRVRAYINYGDFPGEKYVHSIIGNNLRMDEIQAAVLYRKLESNQLNLSNHIRMRIAQAYRDNGVSSFTKASNNMHHLYPILVDNPITFMRVLMDYGIETGNHYPYRLSNLIKGCSLLPTQPTNWSTIISQCVLTLPIGPHMAESDAIYVAETLRKLAVLGDDNIWRLLDAN